MGGKTSSCIPPIQYSIRMGTPRAKFFGNAPALELLDFLERLAPSPRPR